MDEIACILVSQVFKFRFHSFLFPKFIRTINVFVITCIRLIIKQKSINLICNLCYYIYFFFSRKVVIFISLPLHMCCFIQELYLREFLSGISAQTNNFETCYMICSIFTHFLLVLLLKNFF